MTPSKNLNQFLYANRQAGKRIDAELEATASEPENRDLSPETAEATRQALEALRATSVRKDRAA